MNTLIYKSLAKKLSFSSDTMWVELTDGRCLGVPLLFFPKLYNAEKEQLNNYIISGGGVGLHWEDLDEDIIVEGLLLGIGDRSQKQKELAFA